MSLTPLIEDVIRKIKVVISNPNPERGVKWNQGEYAVFTIKIENVTTYHLKNVTVILRWTGCDFAPLLTWYLKSWSSSEMRVNTTSKFLTRFKANSNVTKVKIWAHVTAEIVPLKGLDGFGQREFTIYEE
ncbi:MAG: hypothetical protein FK734_01945 [Asgard group archaeon]|nr:hypothetical protein [Asgard group archaeon]